MKRIFCTLLLLWGYILGAQAAHIRGGELYYRYIGPGRSPNTSIYTVTLKLYIDCGQNAPGQLDEEAALNIFTKPDNVLQEVVIAGRQTNDDFIRYDPKSNPCITNPPLDVCYRLRYFTTTITLANRPEGYTIAFQRCCRIEGIRNVRPPSNEVGATYWCEIPGTNVLPDAIKNSSPVFVTRDAAAICVNSPFVFDFSARDENGDSLSYALCDGYVGGGPSNALNCLSCPVPNPGAPPPYHPLSYQPPYSGNTPLGPDVAIDSKTGILSGTAPPKLGQYVVTVCVSEYRRGVLINIHRKDIHIKVSDCTPLNAQLDPDYSFCKDLNVVFVNRQINPTGSVYTWDFGDGKVDTSRVPDGSIAHKYAGPGDYHVTLRVVLAGQCRDSTSTDAHVYPGFFPGFTYDGTCMFAPFLFTDTTKSRFGHPSLWHWTFGDETTAADSSDIQNPAWLYHSIGFKTVQLIVGSDKGCLDTVVRHIEVKDKPPLSVAFKDTLICIPDSVQLKAIGNGTFQWQPLDGSILNPATPAPIVFPRHTTTYKVTMTEDRCVNTDTVRIRVVSHVTLSAGSDTTICLTDTIRLRPMSDGLRYTWSATPEAAFDDRRKKYPLTSPFDRVTTYKVLATIGSCSAIDTAYVTTVPYPFVNAGPDTTICFDDTASLKAATDGSRFFWDPVTNLIDPNTLTPLAYPKSTATYSLIAYDTLGCPKPGIDKVTVFVDPEIIANAGNDTAVVRGQPLQLHATGSEFFTWTPESGLSRTSIPNPVAVLEDNTTYILRSFNALGCYDYDTINVRVFKTAPDIFVPNAFAPAGRNNVLKPKCAGIAKLDYFRVFNRWGQLMYQTTETDKGWDGRLNGALQNNDTYVWMVSGTDYTGRKVIKKGTAVLIR